MSDKNPRVVKLTAYKLRQLGAEELEQLKDCIIVETEEVNLDELSDADYEQWQIEHADDWRDRL